MLRLLTLLSMVLLTACGAKVDPFTEGYMLGSSDTVKKHYWMMQGLQEPGNNVDNEYKVKWREIPGAKVKNGVNYDDHSDYIKTYE